jgi:hypothetical protein
MTQTGEIKGEEKKQETPLLVSHDQIVLEKE